MGGGRLEKEEGRRREEGVRVREEGGWKEEEGGMREGGKNEEGLDDLRRGKIERRMESFLSSVCLWEARKEPREKYSLFEALR